MNEEFGKNTRDAANGTAYMLHLKEIDNCSNV